MTAHSEPAPVSPAGGSLLVVDDLHTHFRTEAGLVKAVDGVSFHVDAGETVAIVGESGSGKTVTALSIMGLIEEPVGRVASGAIHFDGSSLVDLSEAKYRSIRGRDMAMIFQDPLTSLNPVLRIGDQISEAMLVHHTVASRSAGSRLAAELLHQVGVPQAEQRLRDYPHQFSGGMRQRAMIAMAIANHPKLLIADEPTTALDVSIQAQVLDVLEVAKRETDAALILITHDLGIVAGMADRVIVMYGGRFVEEGTVDDIFYRSRHPYTIGLLDSVPRVDDRRRKLRSIPGSPPSLIRLPTGCAFHPRCAFVEEQCRQARPALQAVAGDEIAHRSACRRADELATLTAAAGTEPAL